MLLHFYDVRHPTVRRGNGRAGRGGAPPGGRCLAAEAGQPWRQR